MGPFSQPQGWVFLAALVLAMAFFQWAKRMFWVFSMLVLPGTFAHECSHWLVGVLLNGQPSRFTLVPRKEGRGWVMGSVGFSHVRWYNAFFIGLAPLLLLPLAYGLSVWRLGQWLGFRWQELLAVYLIANLVYAATPSWQDLKIAVRSPVGWVLLAGGLLWASHAYGYFHSSTSEHRGSSSSAWVPGRTMDLHRSGLGPAAG